jgi:hypothetical protein
MTFRGAGASPTNVTITGGSLNGTNLTNASVTFIPYTPTVTAGAGTLTTASATGRYARIGNRVTVLMTITVTNNGTGATYILTSLPTPPANSFNAFAGRATAVSGSMLQGVTTTAGNSAVFIFTYANLYPAATGETMLLSGVYESL